MSMETGDQPFYQNKDAIPDAMGTWGPKPRFGLPGVRLRHPRFWDGAWDERALQYTQEHLKTEGAVLGEYEKYRDEVSGELAYLIEVIIEDEHRHHQMLLDIAETLRAAEDGDVQGRSHTHPETPLVPTDPNARHALLEHTQRLIAIERQDEVSLKQLADSLKPIADTTIWELVVDVLMLDTKKHERVLKGIEHLIRSAD